MLNKYYKFVKKIMMDANRANTKYECLRTVFSVLVEELAAIMRTNKTNMMQSINYIFIIVLTLGLTLIFTGCKKDVNLPTVYNIQIVDEYTGSPIPDCYVILEEIFYPAASKHDTIGTTNSDGLFKYVFDKNPYDEGDEYSYFNLLFSHVNYYSPQRIPLTKTHLTTDMKFALNKKTTICFKAKRVTSSPELWYYFSNEYTYQNVYNCFSNNAMNNEKCHFETVPSNKVTTISWHTNPWGNNGGLPFNKTDVIAIYNDTTYYSVEY